MIILSLSGHDSLALRCLIDTPRPDIGAIEVRLDALVRTDPATLRMLFEKTTVPLIATCRRKQDGGAFQGSESQRRALLDGAIDAGASFIDLEHGSDVVSLAGKAAENQVEVIVSHHDPAGMPSDPGSLYRDMATVPGVSKVKIVGTANRLDDLLQVRDFLAGLPGPGPQVISFAMGSVGRASRILASAWGSWATYAGISTGEETAPGQMTLSDLSGIYDIDSIDRHTRLVGIIGYPLGHTLSPTIHNVAFSSMGLDFRYLPFELPDVDDLKELRGFIKALNVRGLSVTVPWKLDVMRHLDVVEPLAEKIGAVNTILSDGRRLIGFNTDASGGCSAMSSRLRQLGKQITGSRLAIVGSGGAARALAHAAASAGARVLIASRSSEPGEELAASIGCDHTTPALLAQKDYDILVNCTPVGMPGSPDEYDLPVPAESIKGNLVYDVVYGVETPLLAEARRRGIATLDGSEMLLRQAAQQFELFTGMTAPIDVMRAAAGAAAEKL